MKVLVTGATGFIGGSLARKLIQSGADVRALVRDRTKLAALDLRIDDVVEGDITDARAVGEAMQGVDVVYSIAGTFREASLSDQRYREVNVEAVRNIVEAAQAHGVKRVVHCSTCGIHGSIEGDAADESHPIRPVGIYEQTKAAGERLALEHGQQNGLAVVALRPTPVYGPGDTRLRKLFKLASRKWTLFLGPGSAKYHLVYIDDLVDAFLLAGTAREAPGNAFLIGGPERPSLNELISVLADVLGNTDQRIIRVPVWPFRLAGLVCELLCRPLQLDPPIYRRRVDFFTNNRAYIIDKARNLLGYAPKVRMREGLRRTADWYGRQSMQANGRSGVPGVQTAD